MGLEVFVLGAGFSRAFNSSAPLMQGFLAPHKHLLEPGGEFEQVASFLRQCGLNPENANIETVMTLAAMAKPWADAEQAAHFAVASHQLKRLILRVIDASFQKQWPPPHTYPNPKRGQLKWYRFETRRDDALRRFAAYLLGQQGTSHVITFNYDVLLENAIELEQASLCNDIPSFHAGRCYGFHALKWTSDGAIEPMERRPRYDDPHLLKMHGSVNWRPRKTSGLPIFPSDILVLSAHEDTFGETPVAQAAARAEFEETPFIVPPLLDKTALLENPVLSVIWTRAADYVKQAERLVFVGYSFPPTDFYAESLFRFHKPENCRVEVVNPNPDKDRYRSILGPLPDDSFACEDAADFCGRLGRN